jgi:hypothetical protein
VGMIVVDSAELQLTTFDLSASNTTQAAPGSFDARTMRDAINELNCDLDCWVLAIANPRLAESRSLLRDAKHWVLLSTCDHDGVVGAYRTLKGIADLGARRLSVAAVDAAQPAQAQQVFQKLSGVCKQFLGWSAEPDSAVVEAKQVGECRVMACRMDPGKALPAGESHWQVIAELLSQAASSTPAEEPVNPIDPPASIKPAEAPMAASAQSPTSSPVAQAPTASPTTVEAPRPAIQAAPIPATSPVEVPAQVAALLPEVIDLSSDGGQDSILDAVIKHSLNELIECPIRPPGCPEARLAISRDRRITLLAVAGQGLRELRSIGQGYRWLVENRALLAMALPQFALDAHQHPHLRLLVDQGDINAEVLQPIFQVNTVSIQTYRRVRWGGRTGLLLDAA